MNTEEARYSRSKRAFMAAAALVGTLPGTSLAAPAAAAQGPVVLTLTGAIVHANRGPRDPVRDQLMTRHGASFQRGFAFEAAQLARLPAVEIAPTLEYDARPHRLSGPYLSAVVEAAGVAADAPFMLTLRALDGYTVAFTLAQARAHRTIVATHFEGKPLGIGGLGPLWAVHDADRLPDLKDSPLKERFALCPWGLYAIDLQAQA